MKRFRCTLGEMVGLLMTTGSEFDKTCLLGQNVVGYEADERPLDLVAQAYTLPACFALALVGFF
jgi:hypothetical protein